MIIRSKILYLWKNDKTTVKDFDYGSPGAKSLKYVFDEDKHLSTKDCGNKGLCGTYWASNVRLNHLAFSTRKAIRLAFHDCIPYKDGSGGCDGCINFEDEQNLSDNNVLQHSVATLVRQFDIYYLFALQIFLI